MSGLRYKIFCETDNRWEEYDSILPILECPVNSSHTVRENSLSVIGDSITEYSILHNDFKQYVIGLGTDEESGFDNASEDVKLLCCEHNIGTPVQKLETYGDINQVKKFEEEYRNNINPNAGKSQIISFGSNTQYTVYTNSNKYKKVATFIYTGTDVEGEIKKIVFNSWLDGKDDSTYDIRIFDINNVNTICEIVNNSNNEETDTDVVLDITNLPKTQSVFELQLRRNVGKNSDKVHCASIKIEY